MCIVDNPFTILEKSVLYIIYIYIEAMCLKITPSQFLKKVYYILYIYILKQCV